MHIPNGLLDPKASAGMAFAAAAVLGYCIAKVRQALVAAVPESILAGAGNIAVNITQSSKKMVSSIAENHLMKMAAIGSLVFSAQMFNFPVASGTSGHLLGGILAAVALGPFSGTIVIAIVLAVQSMFFGDGGIMALGANMLNMAVVGTFISYYIYYVLKQRFGFNIGIAVASLFSVLLASAACAIEIGLFGTVDLYNVISAMTLIHARIGIAEALLTILALNFLSSIDLGLEGKLE